MASSTSTVKPGIVPGGEGRERALERGRATARRHDGDHRRTHLRRHLGLDLEPAVGAGQGLGERPLGLGLPGRGRRLLLAGSGEELGEVGLVGQPGVVVAGPLGPARSPTIGAGVLVERDGAATTARRIAPFGHR